MAPIQFVVFDLGGVLVRRYPERLLAALRAAGCSDDRIAQAIHDASLTDAFERGRISPDVLLERVNARLGLSCAEQFWTAWNGILDEEPEAEQILAQLHGRYMLGVLSNTNVVHEADIRQRWPFLQTIDHWIASWCQVGLRKPEAAIFELILRRAGVPAASTVFIDDTEEHVRAARQLGIRAVQRRPGAPLAGVLREAGVTVD